MKITEALAKWSEASTVEPIKGGYVRNGNWQDIQRALRHYTDELSSVDETPDTLNGDAIVCVTKRVEGKPDSKTMLVVK